MSNEQSPGTPDGTDSATVVQQGTPPLALLGSGTDGDSVPLARGGPERYELLEEIARGGMGVVYRAHDRVLDRDVGVKTLLTVPTEGSAIASRFREEAQITGQLQHPNIPPVHDLGTLPDGRPYLAMKLIKGRTLEVMLKDRPDPSHDRGKYLAIFEQIAQGVAYAHAHRVIHRDLKPLNVMVGAFGEVQVMDWGLAKVRTDNSVNAVTASAGNTTVSEIRASRDKSDDTRTGSVLGTPGYMPREQAIGAVDQIDTRSDVFSLGGVLCAILTGKPPYLGADRESTRQLAAVAKLDDAFARLDSCGVEPDLLVLCKQCLSVERDDRPRDAAAVAKAVADLRADAERRARQAELDRVRAEGEQAKAELRVIEKRKRLRVQMLLAVAVGLLTLSSGAFAWWQDRQATERKLAAQNAEIDREREAADRRLTAQREEADRKTERERDAADRRAVEARLVGEREAETRNKAAQARQSVRDGRALADELRKQYKFETARVALAQAAELARSGAPELLPEVEQAQRDLAFVTKLDDIHSRKWLWITEIGSKGYLNTKIAAPEYREAFTERGLQLHLAALNPVDAAKQIAASPISTALVAAVDDWALYEPDKAVQNRLLEVARLANPGPWTDRLRDPVVRGDKAAVAKLAEDADLERTPSASLSVLATLMERHQHNPALLLTTARAKHPTDFQLAFALGQWYTSHGPGGHQVGAYEAARALRPENQTVWNNLAIALADKGEADTAIALLREVIARDPKYATAHFNLGNAYFDKGDLDKAIAAWQEAIVHFPKYATAYANLSAALAKKNKLDESLLAIKKAIEYDQERATLRYNLGLTLKKMGNTDGAIAAYKEALALDSKLGRVHNNLGLALHDKGRLDEAIAAYQEAIKIDPEDAFAYFNWGLTLDQKQDREGAIAAWQKAVKCDPKLAVAHYNLGAALADKGDLDGAIGAWKEAVKQNPKYAAAHTNLGVALAQKGRVEEAIVAFREAIKHDPKLIPAHINLGMALTRMGHVEEAIVAYKDAVLHNPGFALGHYNLGTLYLQQKKYREAIASARDAIKTQPKFAAAHALLADVLIRTDDIPGARTALTEAARLDKRYEPWLAKLPAIPVAPAPREVKRP